LRQFGLAEQAFRKASANDDEDAHAHLGLAYCQLRARQFEAAAESALTALGLRYDLPLAHHNLGVALARLGHESRAIQAFEAALRFQPGLPASHRYLALLYERRGDVGNAQSHRNFLRGRVERRKSWNDFLQTMRRESAERARVRFEARRQMRQQQRAASSPVNSEAMEFLIVSGLPRSGTSLMMQMLNAARVPIMSDDARPADESNPRGYFEWQEIKRLPRDPLTIEKAHGCAVKVISMLLPSLPRKHKFRVIFMDRDVEEVAQSQKKMRQRLAGKASSDEEQMTAQLAQHRARVLELLRQSANIDLLEIDYADLLANSHINTKRVATFAGINREHIEAMIDAIDPSLRCLSGHTAGSFGFARDDGGRLTNQGAKATLGR
jgi:hypothetical protein